MICQHFTDLNEAKLKKQQFGLAIYKQLIIWCVGGETVVEGWRISSQEANKLACMERDTMMANPGWKPHHLI